MNQTEYQQLSLWDQEDRILMEDFNRDNARIDSALSSQAAALALRGNCRIELLSYTGSGTNGSANPTQVAFPKRPLAFVIIGNQSLLLSAEAQGVAVTYHNMAASTLLTHHTLTWSGSTVSFWASDMARQMNNSGEHYVVAALYAMDQET